MRTADAGRLCGITLDDGTACHNHTSGHISGRCWRHREKRPKMTAISQARCRALLEAATVARAHKCENGRGKCCGRTGIGCAASIARDLEILSVHSSVPEGGK